MATYTLRDDDVEAHAIGEHDEPDWYKQLIEDGSIKHVEGVRWDVVTNTGWEHVRAGDYVIFNPTVYAADGSVLSIRSVQAVAKSDFEQLYDTGPLDEPVQPVHPSEQPPAAPVLETPIEELGDEDVTIVR